MNARLFRIVLPSGGCSRTGRFREQNGPSQESRIFGLPFTLVLAKLSCATWLILITVGFTSCQSTKGSSGGSGPAHCVLWDDPGKSAMALHDSTAARQQLDGWVSQHGARQPGILSQPAGVKPMFRLLSVSRDGRILDEVPIYSGSGQPGVAPLLTPADCAALRSCFRAGRPAQVDLAARRVTLR